MTLDNFKQLVQQSKVYITNDYTQLYKSKDFAFFTWSVEAFVNLKGDSGKYEFLVHSKLSYVSTYLLANLNNSPKAICAAKMLTGEEVTSLLQNKDGYFSPYGDDKNVNNPILKKTYKQFLTNLPKLSCITSVSHDEFNPLDSVWDIVRLNFDK